MKFDAKEALDLSIRHWERLYTRKERPRERPGAEDCTLCQTFNEHGNDCRGCPIYEKTGVTVCEDTPFEAAHREWENYAPLGEQPNAFVEKAKIMYDWLVQLREEMK